MRESEIRKLIPGERDAFYQHPDNVINRLICMLKVEKEDARELRDIIRVRTKTIAKLIKQIEQARRQPTIPFSTN